MDDEQSNDTNEHLPEEQPNKNNQRPADDNPIETEKHDKPTGDEGNKTKSIIDGLKPESRNNDNEAEEKTEQQNTKPVESDKLTTNKEPAEPTGESSKNDASTPNKPLIILLQWLTYVFWGWLLIGLIYVIFFLVLSYFDDGRYDDNGVIYGLVTMSVLYVFAAVTDFFYSKKEPVNKKGVATVVMVIHAVIFALFAVGFLVSFLIATVNGLLNEFNYLNKTFMVLSLLMFPLYGFTFLRTILPSKFVKIRLVYRVAVGIICFVLMIATIFGPVAKIYMTKEDRLIENSLYDITRSIADYSSQNKHLPENLGQLDKSKLNDSADEVLKRNLIEYKPNTRTASIPISGSYSSRNSKIHYYQLCVNYSHATTGKTNSYSDDISQDSDGYSSYVSADSHDAGRECYLLKTTVYTSTY